MSAKISASQSGPPTPGGEPGPSFEEALERLEAIVEELEGGSLTLEESIARYEEGITLSRRLTLTLDEAEKRIERLVETEGGTPATEPMELDVENSNPPAARPTEPPDQVPAAGGATRGQRPSTARTPTEATTRGRPDLPDELPF